MKGVLPDHVLKRILRGHIVGIDEEFVNPASIDLPLGTEAYRLNRVFLPQAGRTVRSYLERYGTRFDLNNRLEVGVPYLVRIQAEFRLPPEVYGYFNPKSTTGRINLLCRVVADGVPMYDALVPEGYQGEVWALLRPESFPILVRPGKAVTQLRLFDGKNFLDGLEVSLEAEECGLFYHPNGQRFKADEFARHSDSLFMTVRVEPGMPAWECRGSTAELDYGRLNYPPSDFFQPINACNGEIDLRKGSFYILGTYEHLCLGPTVSAELRAIDPRFGEFRSHAAGFIDPGWGWGVEGEGTGRPITLEITPHENITIQHRQTIARVRFERMKSRPEVLYEVGKPSYAGQNQGAALSKHFATA